MQTSFGRNKTFTAIAFAAMLASCGGNSSESVVIAGDFTAYGVKGTVSGQNVSLDLSALGNCVTSVDNMVIGINANGANVSPDPRIARDYSQPAQFTLTAVDGTKVVYTVTVKGAACLNTSMPTSTPSPIPTPTPAVCAAAAIDPAEPYSLVFKGCSVANVAEYYDKTECVRQNSTGLIWQGQTAAGTGLRANDNYFTNYDKPNSQQKLISFVNNVITSAAPTQGEIDASSNSIGYKNDVNMSNLCNSNAWRLPTKDELLGLVKTTGSPTIDNSWFPNTVAWKYWTSDPAVGTWNAWFVNFNDGVADYYYRDAYNGGGQRNIRLVQ